MYIFSMCIIITSSIAPTASTSILFVMYYLIRASFLRSRVEPREGLMIESALQRLDGRWIDDGLVVRFGQNGTDAVDEYVTQRL